MTQTEGVRPQGHLVTITSASERDLLMANNMPDVVLDAGAWIGAPGMVVMSSSYREGVAGGLGDLLAVADDVIQDPRLGPKPEHKKTATRSIRPPIGVRAMARPGSPE